MATAFISIEPAFELEDLIVPERDEPAFIRRPQSKWDARAIVEAPVDESGPDDDEPATERKTPERRANLGFCILLAAVDDYRGSNEREHRSAALFLFPINEDYRAQLRWAIGLAGMSEFHTRKTLDRRRPRWDAERKRGN
jgi:hypothetical protein